KCWPTSKPWSRPASRSDIAGPSTRSTRTSRCRTSRHTINGGGQCSRRRLCGATSPLIAAPETCAVSGDPDRRHVSTSYVERQNLTIRVGMRRFTRLTNGFSKKAENLAHNLALHYMHYNFCRVHQTLRVTPAMEAGIADHVWEIEELIALLDAKEAQKPARRGPYKKAANSN